MSLDQFLEGNHCNSLDKDSLRNIQISIKKLEAIIDALNGFEGNLDRMMNLSKLAKRLKLDPKDMDVVIDIIIKLQENFATILEGRKLIKAKRGKQDYLAAEIRKDKKPETSESIELLREEIGTLSEDFDVVMKSEQVKGLSDIIYVFKKVRGGKGFDVSRNDNKIVKNLRNLKEEYPFLFRVNGNDLVYPSEVGLKLGDLVQSYNKLNKEINQLKVDNYKFKFE